jgi:hypothetical protein
MYEKYRIVERIDGTGRVITKFKKKFFGGRIILPTIRLKKMRNDG